MPPLLDLFPQSLGDDHHVDLVVESTGAHVMLFFNTLAKIQRKVHEFDGPEGWRIVPCAYNAAGCTTVVFHRDEISDRTLEEVCELYELEILELERMSASHTDMSLLIKKSLIP